MKKCLGVVAVLLVVSGALQAATTVSTVNSGYRFGQNVLFDTLTPPDIWTWSNTGILPTDGVWDTETITSATMQIQYSGVSIGQNFTIKADNVTLGTLAQNANGDTNTTTFNLLSPTNNTGLFTSDGTLNMSISTSMWAGLRSILNYATVTVEYDVPTPPEPPVEPTPVPAPGAVVLGGLGLGLVSWLRSRKTL